MAETRVKCCDANLQVLIIHFHFTSHPGGDKSTGVSQAPATLSRSQNHKLGRDGLARTRTRRQHHQKGGVTEERRSLIPEWWVPPWRYGGWVRLHSPVLVFCPQLMLPALPWATLAPQPSLHGAPPDNLRSSLLSLSLSARNLPSLSAHMGGGGLEPTCCQMPMDLENLRNMPSMIRYGIELLRPQGYTS